MSGDTSNGGHPGNPPWQSKTLWIAAGLALLGLVLWMTVPREEPPPTAKPGQTTLAQASGEAVATKVHTLQGSPALFRFGISYIAGFALGYGLRRFVKLTLLLSVVAFVALFFLRKSGWLDLDWSVVEDHLSDSFAWLRGQAEALKVFATGYVPSAVAAGVGLFLGARWR